MKQALRPSSQQVTPGTNGPSSGLSPEDAALVTRIARSLPTDRQDAFMARIRQLVACHAGSRLTSPQVEVAIRLALDAASQEA